MLKHLPFLLFTLLFLFLANWHVLLSTFQGLREPKQPYQKVQDEELARLIQDKTGLRVQSFYIVNSDKLFGGMSGLPSAPVMTLSKEMYETFSKGEMEYVAMHEAGHLALWHPAKSFIIQALVVVIGFLVWRVVKLPLPTALILASSMAVIVGIGVIRYGRNFEWQANTYALERLSNPADMISATHKFEQSWDWPPYETLFGQLFYIGMPYKQRIEMAEEYNQK